MLQWRVCWAACALTWGRGGGVLPRGRGGGVCVTWGRGGGEFVTWGRGGGVLARGRGGGVPGGGECVMGPWLWGAFGAAG